MSALAQQGLNSQQPTNSFHASLVLGDGITAHVSAPTIDDLQRVVDRLQPASNDTAKPPKADKVKPQEQPAGNAAPASTGTPASAPPAASGSASGGEAVAPNYNDVRDRVLKLAKLSRETAAGALAKFGVDHGNKLKLEQYPEFLAHADSLLAKGGAGA
jgi:hypothetical protein